MTNKRTLAVYLNNDLIHEARQMADDKGLSTSDLVSKALTEYLERQRNTPIEKLRALRNIKKEIEKLETLI